MRRRLFLILALAVVVGGITSGLIYHRLTSQEPSEGIVVASVNMTLAETVTSKHVELVAWPKRSIPPGAIRSLAEAEGRVVRSSIVKGEPLLEAKLAPQLAGKGGIMPMLVPEGQRGVTIKVDEAIRESGFVLPNSRVDVLVSMPKKAGDLERVAKVILQDVAVLAAGQSVEMRGNDPVTVTTVTLSLTPEQVERLALAQNEGKLMLATRNLRDNSIVHTPGATAASILGSEAPAPPRAEPAVAKATRKASPSRVASAPLPAPRGHTVAVLRGSKVTEYQFVSVGGQEWVERQK